MKFDVEAFLTKVGEGRRILSLSPKSVVFAQGSPCDSLFYIQAGRIRLTVVAKSGKEATIGVMNPGDFFGEGCLAGQRLRMLSATTMTDCLIMQIKSKAMLETLHRETEFSDRFTAYLLSRNIRYEEDLVDQLFNSGEKRLARILLLLAHYGKEGRTDEVIPKIRQEDLAAMVGTTRPRISRFMNKFRKLGFIEYNGQIKVHSSLLSIVLHD